MFAQELLKILLCPNCKEKVQLENMQLVCKGCDSIYQIKGEVPLMLKDPVSAYWKENSENKAQKYGGNFLSCDYRSKNSFLFEQKSILKWVNKESTLILDVGCGPGLFTEPLLNGKTKVIGADISSGMLEHAKNRGLLPVQANALYLPFYDEIFDTVLAVEMVQCLEDLDGFIREALRVTKKKGQVIIATLNAASFIRKIHRLFNRDYKYLKMYQIDQTISLFQDNRLGNIQIMCFYYPLLFKTISNRVTRMHKFLAASFVLKAQKKG